MALEECLLRHDWASLATVNGTAERVPGAIRGLLSATTADEVTRAYWSLDNVVVVQGTLTDAAEATAECLLAGFDECTEFARSSVLELLVQLASGYGEPEPQRSARIAESLQVLAPTVLGLAQSGSGEEQLQAIDLLVLLAQANPALRAKAIDVGRNLLSDSAGEQRGRQLLEWLGVS